MRASARCEISSAREAGGSRGRFAQPARRSGGCRNGELVRDDDQQGARRGGRARGREGARAGGRLRAAELLARSRPGRGDLPLRDRPPDRLPGPLPGRWEGAVRGQRVALGRGAPGGAAPARLAERRFAARRDPRAPCGAVSDRRRDGGRPGAPRGAVARPGRRARARPRGRGGGVARRRRRPSRRRRRAARAIGPLRGVRRPAGQEVVSVREGLRPARAGSVFTTPRAGRCAPTTF